MISASGMIHYISVSGIIERIVDYYSNTPIPDMGKEDVKQEIRLKCWVYVNASGFDPYRCQHEHFNYFKKTAHDVVYNLRRGLIVPNNGPCNRCEFWNRKVKRCTSNQEECKKFQKYQHFMKTKLALKSPVGYDTKYMECISHDYIDDREIFTLEEHIIFNMPFEMQQDYALLRNGYSIDPERESELKKLIINILYER